MNNNVIRSLYKGTLSTDICSLTDTDEFKKAKEYAIMRLKEIQLAGYSDEEQMFDDIYSAMGQVSFYESRENFVLGWKLGAQFTLASFTSPDTKDIFTF